MTDIVERLRAPTLTALAALREDAADEIEKLRTILREARNALGAASPFMFASRTTPTQSSVAVLATIDAALAAAPSDPAP